VPVGITEIDAAAATFPIISSFDDHPTRSEMHLPAVEFVLGDGKCHMQYTIPAMAGNGAAGG